jgi:competence protein ComEC
VQWHPGVLEITAIDVGQGDSLLIVTPEGNALLLDSGGIGGGTRSDFDVGEEVVSPYLWSRGIRHLDVVAMSHPHSDHIGGMRAIIANFRPKELWYGLDSPTPEFAEVAEAAKSFDVTLKPHIAGDKFEFGGVQFRVLNPQPGEIATNKTQDDESMVLRLQYGRTAALLVGDSHKRIEELLIQEMPQADLLKPHLQLTGISGGGGAAIRRRFSGILQLVPPPSPGGDAALRRTARSNLSH